jgi:hypothetical protein
MRSHHQLYDNFRLDIFVREVKDIAGGQVPDACTCIIIHKETGIYSLHTGHIYFCMYEHGMWKYSVTDTYIIHTYTTIHMCMKCMYECVHFCFYVHVCCYFRFISLVYVVCICFYIVVICACIICMCMYQ